ncbi:hypothetical protein [Desulfosporosinus nitroreducens]|uniref:Uncharacterized protein n=1 Tax=Desulfosporosinus nitroreducens TaxID=2018668 RepID=A0ABT8QUI2_9FIRM|nr:hypothetical protein [Desulfosporosinus nitroreducens]MCO1602738.1 hypothetical protein [Desulfosporosinus nitroreducens]MDO0825011.1 hypothetical protein [Desulfosporosinus nitroreducens]
MFRGRIGGSRLSKYGSYGAPVGSNFQPRFFGRSRIGGYSDAEISSLLLVALVI